MLSGLWNGRLPLHALLQLLLLRTVHSMGDSRRRHTADRWPTIRAHGHRVAAERRLTGTGRTRKPATLLLLAGE